MQCEVASNGFPTKSADESSTHSDSVLRALPPSTNRELLIEGNATNLKGARASYLPQRPHSLNGNVAMRKLNLNVSTNRWRSVR
jgi:hypothetical protein